jgi:hypothetical protein
MLGCCTDAAREDMMPARFTVASGLHHVGDALLALVAVIREGIAEDRRWKKELAQKRDHLRVVTDGSPGHGMLNPGD